MGLQGIGWQEVVLGDPLMAPYATPPVVSIDVPASDGQVVSGTVQISASASPTNSPGISRVVFRINDEFIGSSTSPPFQTAFDTSGLPGGLHIIEATAYENDPVANTGSAYRTVIIDDGSVFASGVRDIIGLPDESQFALKDMTVTAAYNGYFYIRDSDNLCGIAVKSSRAVSEGDLVTVFGSLATVNGQREIDAEYVF